MKVNTLPDAINLVAMSDEGVGQECGKPHHFNTVASDMP